ncbi:disulfide bond formation protein B [Leptospira sp. severe_002]|uniref:disulfide bond formation protein B n=1 Tax=Leptospira sp. severe_002 TaxID=2838237 RepID=UPI001E62F355|nr:disulfide bond formation protein B [Leptospira sp. severe_002]
MIAQASTFARTQPIASAAAVIAVVGIAALCGAWFFQYVIGLPPCPLCLEQRVAYYVSIPLAAMILLGVSVGAKHKVLVLALFAIGAAMLWNAGLGVYHSGVEWHFWQGPQDCSGTGSSLTAGGSLLDQMQTTRVVRCDEAAWRFLGLSLAGYNVLISLALAVVAISAAVAALKRMPREEPVT